MNSKPRILLIKKAHLRNDVRTLRRANILAECYEVSIAALSGDTTAPFAQFTTQNSLPNHFVLPSRIYRKVVRTLKDRHIQQFDFANMVENDFWRKSIVKQLKNRKFDLILASDVDALPAALELAKGSPVLIDLHEHAPTELEGIDGWLETTGRYKSWLCSKYLELASSHITVSDSLAEAYSNEFGIPKPGVIRNAHPFHARQREQSKFAPTRFIHTGITGPNRRLEIHGELARELGSPYEINMLLKEVSYKYTKEFAKFAEKISNFHILNEVPPNMIVSKLSEYDAGIYLMDQVTTQMRVTLPNKFFEYIQARIPIFSGGLPEMDKLISEFDIGVPNISRTPKLAADLIKELDIDWLRIGKNLDLAARSLSLENESTKLIELVNSLLE